MRLFGAQNVCKSKQRHDTFGRVVETFHPAIVASLAAGVDLSTKSRSVAQMGAVEAFLKTVVRREAGASSSEIKDVEKARCQPLPADLKAFLATSNGAEGFNALAQYYMLWSTSRICSLNESYAVDEHLPGITLIGTDGGDTGFGFTWSANEARYVSVPLVGMSRDHVVIEGGSLDELLTRAPS